MQDPSPTAQAHPGSIATVRDLVAFEHAPDARVALDVERRLLWLNAAAERLMDAPRTHLIGRRLEDVVAPESAAEAEEVFAILVRSAGLAVVPLTVSTTSARRLALEASLAFLRDGDRIVGLHGIVRDVTPPREAEAALRESEARYRTVFDGAPLAIVQIDLQGRIADVNRAAEEVSGYSVRDLRGRDGSTMVHPEDRDAAQADFARLVAGDAERYSAERRYMRRDGTPFWAKATASLVRDDDRRPLFCLVMVENVTARVRAENELRDTNTRLSGWIAELEERTRQISLLSELGDMLRACRTEGEAYAVTRSIASRLFPSAAGCLSRATGGSVPALEQVAAWGGWQAPDTFRLDECWAVRLGRPHHADQDGSGPACTHLPSGAQSHLCVPLVAHGELVGVFSLGFSGGTAAPDASRRLAMTVAEHVALALANVKLHETLRSQSIRDPLTGLFNRRYMEESLEREMRRAARAGEPVGIIMVDVDHFKTINDRYGHEAGDAALAAVGAMLQRSVRAEDIACRYGGEEFTLILPEATLVDSARRAEYLREAVRQLVIPYGRQALPQLTLSAGVATFPDHGPTGDAVLRAADAALYEAKARGRDRVALNHAGGLFAEGIDVLRAPDR